MEIKIKQLAVVGDTRAHIVYVLGADGKLYYQNMNAGQSRRKWVEVLPPGDPDTISLDEIKSATRVVPARCVHDVHGVDCNTCYPLEPTSIPQNGVATLRDRFNERKASVVPSPELIAAFTKGSTDDNG